MSAVPVFGPRAPQFIASAAAAGAMFCGCEEAALPPPATAPPDVGPSAVVPPPPPAKTAAAESSGEAPTSTDPPDWNFFGPPPPVSLAAPPGPPKTEYALRGFWEIDGRRVAQFRVGRPGEPGRILLLGAGESRDGLTALELGENFARVLREGEEAPFVLWPTPAAPAPTAPTVLPGEAPGAWADRPPTFGAGRQTWIARLPPAVSPASRVRPPGGLRAGDRLPPPPAPPAPPPEVPSPRSP
ncbi:hypothetical protein [Alienimonas sp. DA493]|uniref:hypothetical protein n=1 Tax=Alienimonas sp. DA493 TaxID=3373605 RepID=UPI003754ED99